VWPQSAACPFDGDHWSESARPKLIELSRGEGKTNFYPGEVEGLK